MEDVFYLFFAKFLQKNQKLFKVFSVANISLCSRPTKVAASICFQQISIH